MSDKSNEGKPGTELRDCLADERTFFAWIRTGLALMGFGFVMTHKPGHYTLLARAKDASDLVQPDEHDPNYGS